MAEQTNVGVEVGTNVVVTTNGVVEGLPADAVTGGTNFVQVLETTLSRGGDSVMRFGEWLRTSFPKWLATDGLAIVITLVMALVALRLAGVVASRLTAFIARGKTDSESEKRAQTLSEVIRWVLRLTIYIIAGMMVLDKFGVQIGPVIAAAGIVGLAVGFGAQTLVQDVISGFFILLEDQIRVGDVVNLNDKGGLVERITLRMIVLRDMSGNVHYVRNGQINVITNMTKDFSH